MKKASSDMEDFREKLDRSYREHVRKEGGDDMGITANTLLAWRPPVPQQGDTWGNWMYNAETLVLTHVPTDYEVDLEDCTASARMLDWIFQVCAKSWATTEDLGHLVQALDDLLNPQANLCSFGADKKFDVKKHLTQRT